jgi:isoleucyl-tRNA synthetase
LFEEDKFIKLYAKPNSPVLGKKLGKEFGRFRGLIQNLPSDKLRDLESGETIEVEGQTFNNEEILIFREALEGKDVSSNSYISMALDCKLDESLISEGLAREVVNRIQKTRKDLNFNVSDRIAIKYKGSKAIENAIQSHQDYICKETLCLELSLAPDSEFEHQFDIDDEKLEMLITK